MSPKSRQGVLVAAVATAAAGLGWAAAANAPVVAGGIAVAGLLVLFRLLIRPLAASHQRDTWGGRTVTVLAVSVVVSALVTRVVDGATQRVASNGDRYLVSSGRIGSLVGLALLTVAIGVGLHVIASSGRRLHLGSGYAQWMVLLIAWWLVSTAFRGELGGPAGLVTAAGIAVVTAAVVNSPPTRETLISLTHVVNLAVITGLAYGLANMDQQLPCRADKCGIFGNLFVGYLFQENGAARFIVMVLPAAAAVRSRAYLLVTLAGSAVFVLATGSRTSLLSFAVAVVAVVVLRRFVLRPSAEVRVPRWIRALPFVVLLAAGWEFLTAAPYDLTGRGEIYASIRGSLDGFALLRGTSSNLVTTLSSGYRAMGEHGQVPHLLTHAGVPGLLLFTCALLALALGRRWGWREAVGFAFVAVAATQYLTESAWTLSLQSMPFVALLLSVGLFVPARAGDQDQVLREPVTATPTPGGPAASAELDRQSRHVRCGPGRGEARLMSTFLR